MSGQLGWKQESTWGTAVTVDVFQPVLSVKPRVDEGYIRSMGIRAGRRTRNPARLGRRVVGADVEMELPNTSLAVLLKHYFGGYAFGAGSPNTHTNTPGAHLSKSLTIQGGVEDTGGTVRPFTWEGAKIDTWSISAAVGDLCKTSFGFTGEDVSTGTALASASYATITPFSFVEASVTVNGSAVASANAVTLTCNKGLRNDRHVLGSRLIKEQREQDKFEFITEITADFDDLTLFALQAAATQVASVLTISNGTESLVITCSGQVVGDPPSLENQGIEAQTIRLDHSHASSDASAITAVLSNTEATAA